MKKSPSFFSEYFNFSFNSSVHFEQFSLQSPENSASPHGLLSFNNFSLSLPLLISYIFDIIYGFPGTSPISSTDELLLLTAIIIKLFFSAFKIFFHKFSFKRILFLFKIITSV